MLGSAIISFLSSGRCHGACGGGLLLGGLVCLLCGVLSWFWVFDCCFEFLGLLLLLFWLACSLFKYNCLVGAGGREEKVFGLGTYLKCVSLDMVLLSLSEVPDL